jgi:hypothetical protein
MWHSLKLILASASGMALAVAGMWAWQRAPQLWDGATRPDVSVWAIRSAAVAALAAAQIVLLLTVVAALFERRGFDLLLRLGAGVVAAVCIISAVALALAAR